MCSRPAVDLAGIGGRIQAQGIWYQHLCPNLPHTASQTLGHGLLASNIWILDKQRILFGIGYGTPGSWDGKEFFLQCRRLKFDPWVGKFPWRREWQPTPVFLPGEFHGQRTLVGYSPWGHKESDMTEWLTHMFHAVFGTTLLIPSCQRRFISSFVGVGCGHETLSSMPGPVPSTHPLTCPSWLYNSQTVLSVEPTVSQTDSTLSPVLIVL